MININNKTWDKLNATDIQEFLKGVDDETFFFEFKKDDVDTKKVAEEISAFANTYGGYILLGVEDDKSISGCHQWNEEKVHTVIHDCITPTPTFDIKKFEIEKETVIVVKIEEGNAPPYITNKGKIYERLSSGSYVVKSSEKLSQMYHKREEQLKRVEQKLKITRLSEGVSLPKNIFGCIDMGFSITTSEITDFQKNFNSIDFSDIVAFIKETFSQFSISKVGRSYMFTFGEAKVSNGQEQIPSRCGMHNFMEIMLDGSVKCRVLLIADTGSSDVNINATVCFLAIYRRIYEKLFGDDFDKIFISALKYEELTVINQFTPYYGIYDEDDEEEIYNNYLSKHIEKYGNNLVVEGNRIPKSGFSEIDRQKFDEAGIVFNKDNLLRELFVVEHYNLGYIDPPIKED